MSDEAPRSAQGNRPDQRRGRGAPAWWDALQRTDLPDDPHAETIVETAGWDVGHTFPGTRRRGRLGVAITAMSAVLVAIAVAVAVWAATTVTGHNAGLTAAVIVGVPAVLLVASLLVSLPGRRRRR